MTVTIQEATEQLIQAIREDMLAKLTGGLGSVRVKPAPKTSRGDIKTRVLAFVRANKGCARSDIVNGTGLVPIRVTNALGLLRRAGKIKATGSRRFATWQAVK